VTHEQTQAAKAAYRAEAASRPLAEKVALMERLRLRAVELRELRESSRGAAELSVEHPAR
jgi:hypothetical protein